MKLHGKGQSVEEIATEMRKLLATPGIKVKLWDDECDATGVSVETDCEGQKYIKIHGQEVS